MLSGLSTFTSRLTPHRRRPGATFVLRTAARGVALAALALSAVTLTVLAGHTDLLHRMPIFQGAQSIEGVTEFLDSLKGYLISIVLAGFTVAGIAVGAAKLSGHSRANDMIFNVGVGVAIFAALPTIVA
jgi:hypothetical protein